MAAELDEARSLGSSSILDTTRGSRPVQGDEEAAAMENFLAPCGAPAAGAPHQRQQKMPPSGALYAIYISLLNAIFSNSNSIFLIDTPFFE